MSDRGPRVEQADPIYEHKKGRVWQIVARQEKEIRALRYQVKVLQVRCRRA